MLEKRIPKKTFRYLIKEYYDNTKGDLIRTEAYGCGFEYEPKKPYDLKNNIQPYHAFIHDGSSRWLIKIIGRHEDSIATDIACAFKASCDSCKRFTFIGTIKDLEPMILELKLIDFSGYIYGNKKDVQEYKESEEAYERYLLQMD